MKNKPAEQEPKQEWFTVEEIERILIERGFEFSGRKDQNLKTTLHYYTKNGLITPPTHRRIGKKYTALYYHVVIDELFEISRYKKQNMPIEDMKVFLKYNRLNSLLGFHLRDMEQHIGRMGIDTSNLNLRRINNDKGHFIIAILDEEKTNDFEKFIDSIKGKFGMKTQNCYQLEYGDSHLVDNRNNSRIKQPQK